MATSGTKSGLTLTPRSSGLTLPPTKSSLNDKLRSLMRGSEIALMRISSSNLVNNNNISLNKHTSSTSPPSSSCPSAPVRTSTSTCHSSPSIGVTSNKEDSNTITISITSSGSVSSSSSLGPAAVNGLPGPVKKSISKPRTKPISNIIQSIVSEKTKPTAKKRKKDTSKPSPVDPPKFVYSRFSLGPFDTHFEEEVLTDDSTDDIDMKEISPVCHFGSSLPFPSSSYRETLIDDTELNDLRSRILTQKLLLKRWIRVKTSEMERASSHVDEEMKLERRTKRTFLDECLDENRQRVCGLESPFRTTSTSIRKGICCFAEDETRCPKPSIPFSRHCLTHILYNVDQMMFERCTAKDPLSLTQCSNPTFDIERDEPLCDGHVKSSCDMTSETSQETPKNASRRRAKPSSSRRKKRKPVGGKGSKEITTPVEDSSIESNQATEASDSVACGTVSVRSLANGVDSQTIPASLDVGIKLAPVDEALVASLVHDLPFESEQTEFNMIPDDAFGDLFNEAIKSNPEIEHSQFVSKNCHPMTNGDSTYNYNHISGHLNGQSMQHQRPSGGVQMMPNLEDISSLPANILDFLTTEQQQQLNGLIDGDLSLTSSPTMKCNPVMTEYLPNGHSNMYNHHHHHHHQLPVTGLPPNGMKLGPHIVEVPLATHNNQDQMLPPTAAFAQFGPRQNPPLHRSLVPCSNRFTGTPGSSIKISSLNDSSIARNLFVKISDLGNPHPNSQFNKLHSVNSRHPSQKSTSTIKVGPPIFEEKSGGN